MNTCGDCLSWITFNGDSRASRGSEAKMPLSKFIWDSEEIGLCTCPKTVHRGMLLSEKHTACAEFHDLVTIEI